MILTDGEIGVCLEQSGWVIRDKEAGNEFALLARQVEKAVINKLRGLDRNDSMGNNNPNGM